MPYKDADKVVSNVRKWKRANPDKVREQKWRARARKQPHTATLYHQDKSSPIVQQLIQEYVAASRVRWETNQKPGAPNGNFRENICSEDDLRPRIFGAFVVKFPACLPLLGFSNIYKMV